MKKHIYPPLRRYKKEGCPFYRDNPLFIVLFYPYLSTVYTFGVFPELFLLPEFKGYSGKTELFVPWEEYLKKRKAEEKYQPSKKTNKTQKKWVKGNGVLDHWEFKDVPVYEPLSEDEIYQEWKRYAEEWEKDKYIFSISITPNEFVEIYAGNQDLRNIKPSYFDRILYAGTRRIRGRGLEYLLRYKNFSQLPQLAQVFGNNPSQFMADHRVLIQDSHELIQLLAQALPECETTCRFLEHLIQSFIAEVTATLSVVCASSGANWVAVIKQLIVMPWYTLPTREQLYLLHSSQPTSSMKV